MSVLIYPAILAPHKAQSSANWRTGAVPIRGAAYTRLASSSVQAGDAYERERTRKRRGRRPPAGAPHAEGVTKMAAGEAPVKQAVKWIDDRLQDEPSADRVKLVDEASRRFDLSPLDTDFLFRHLAQRLKR